MSKTEKNIIKLVVLFVAVIVVLLLMLYLFRFNYSYNENLKNYYYDNETVFDSYINSFEIDNKIDSADEYYKYYDGVVSDETFDSYFSDCNIYPLTNELKNIDVCSVTYYNSCLFFEYSNTDGYYGGLYYSFNGDYCENSPFKEITVNNEKYTFREVKENLYVNGAKNTGADWYLTSKIDGNWYYYEAHY